MRKMLLVFVLLMISGSAWAACTNPLVVKDGTGASQNMSVKTGADSNCQSYFDADTSSNLYTAMTSAIAAGTNNIGFVTATPSATGGWTYWSTPANNSNTALTATVVTVKASAAANFGGYFISNPNGGVACVQVFDVATAGAVTLGTTRPNMVFCVPGTSGANFEMVNGVKMTNGIQIAATTTASGLTAAAAGLDVTILYK
jgi:hypothetical protein